METGTIKVKGLDIFLSLLRIFIGWHFLYEGISKLFTPGWTSFSYLSTSNWLFANLFHDMAANPAVLKVVDMLNIWGLILIGLALFFGIFTRLASGFGILLLSLYYIAHPPFLAAGLATPTEGQYLIVNKNLIEIFALTIFLILPANMVPGLDRLISLMAQRAGKGKPATADNQDLQSGKPNIGRRELIKNLAALPIFGGFVVAAVKKKGWISYEEKFLEKPDATTSATIKSFNFSSLKDLKEKVPHAKIAGVDFSRVILGGNLIGGWAHARDLIYVSKLVKSYFNDEKVFETFWLAEQCGINAFLTNPVLCRVINEYWRRKIGNIKFISDCGGGDIMKGAKISIDHGASACYIHGGAADRLVSEGKIDEIAKTVEFIKENGLPAGIGGHKLETIKGCVEYGLKPDFWMKTLHHTHYWSANKENQHDNIWCTDPKDTIEYMKSLEAPWLAFKTLAAGAIHPKVGFKYAFQNGADFIVVGMYDFQIVDDVNIALDVLHSDLKRARPWRA